MTDGPDMTPSAGKSSPATIVFLLLATLLFAYPLSLGPTLKLWGRPPPGPVRAFYAPLEQLSQECQPVETLLVWYIRDVWRVP